MSEYYDILSEQAGAGEGLWTIRLRQEADVYRGHFPGQPIAPGACNIEMLRQLASRMAGREIRFAEIAQCRFTHLITPSVENPLAVGIRIEGQRLVATIHHGDTLCVQLKATVVQ